jgi:ribonuclease P protein component
MTHDPAPAPSLRLPRGSRVRLGSEVRRAFDRGRSAAAGPLVVYAYDRADSRPARYALVVGRRWGGAVERNRVRRLLREAFRTRRPELALGFDFALLPRAPLGRTPLGGPGRDLTSAARRAAARFREHGENTDPPRERRRRR